MKATCTMKSNGSGASPGPAPAKLNSGSIVYGLSRTPLQIWKVGVGAVRFKSLIALELIVAASLFAPNPGTTLELWHCRPFGTHYGETDHSLMVVILLGNERRYARIGEEPARHACYQLKVFEKLFLSL